MMQLFLRENSSSTTSTWPGKELKILSGDPWNYLISSWSVLNRHLQNVVEN